MHRHGVASAIAAVSLVWLLRAAAAVSGEGDRANPPTFGSSADRILVDAIVTDGEDRTVKGVFETPVQR